MKKNHVSHVDPDVILSIQEKTETIVREYIGSVLSLELAQAITRRIAESFAQVRDVNAIVAIQDLLQQPITEKTAYDIGWRIGGNYNFLTPMTPIKVTSSQIYTWTGVAPTKPCILRVCNVDKAFRNKDTFIETRRYDYSIEFLIMNNCPAGRRTMAYFSEQSFRTLAGLMGFIFRNIYSSRPVSKGWRVFNHYTELYNMYVLGVVNPDKSSYDRISFGKYVNNKILSKKNIRLMEKRSRLGFRCPLGYSDDKLCYTCPAGTDVCEAAVRRISLPVLKGSMNTKGETNV